MLVKALITGVEHVKNKPESEKKFDFHKVNFIDLQNPAGSPQSMTLANDDSLITNLTTFEASRMKEITFIMFMNGNYANFGGFQK